MSRVPPRRPLRHRYDSSRPRWQWWLFGVAFAFGLWLALLVTDDDGRPQRFEHTTTTEAQP